MAIGKIAKKVVHYKEFVHIPLNMSFKDVKNNRGYMVFKFIKPNYGDSVQFVIKVGILGHNLLVYETVTVMGEEIKVLTELLAIFTDQPKHSSFDSGVTTNLRLNFKVARMHNDPTVRFSSLFSDYDLYIDWSEIDKIVDRLKEAIVEMSLVKPFYMELR